MFKLSRWWRPAAVTLTVRSHTSKFHVTQSEADQAAEVQAAVHPLPVTMSGAEACGYALHRPRRSSTFLGYPAGAILTPFTTPCISRKQAGSSTSWCPSKVAPMAAMPTPVTAGGCMCFGNLQAPAHNLVTGIAIRPDGFGCR